MWQTIIPSSYQWYASMVVEHLILHSHPHVQSNNTAHYTTILHIPQSLQWRHNERDGVSNHQPHDCLLNRLFRYRSKKASKLRVTGLCDRWIPRTEGQQRGKCLHFMTSSYAPRNYPIEVISGIHGSEQRGLLSQFPPFCYFTIFQLYQNTCWPLNIAYIDVIQMI